MNCRKFFHAVMLLPAFCISAHAQDASSQVEARQLVEETTPQAKARLAKREAQAAYQEAIADCKKARGAERNTCMREAKAQLQHDLADAQKNLTTRQ